MKNVKNVLEDTKVKEKARQNKVYCIKNKSMRIKTLIKTFIERKAQLMEVMVEDTNTDYFINKIEKNLNNKLTCVTNVKGEMTDWNFFNKDKNFHDVLKKGLHNSKIKYPELSLQDSWGIKLLKNQQTKFHTHELCTMSGILYLNDCKTPLEFPELDIEIYPKKNSVLFFDGFLEHGTKKTLDEVKYAISFNFTRNISWTGKDK